MKIRGIKKGDKDLRHFTFDDVDDVTIRGGVYMYKVTYDKNPLEGEYGDEEIGYIECDKVIPLGGKKPKSITPQKDTEDTTKEHIEKQPTKKGRKPKVETISEISKDVVCSKETKYEYLVTDIKAQSTEKLQMILNEYGDDYWELCGFDTTKNLFGLIHITAFFKRKRG